MAAIEQQSGITTWMSERPRCDQMHEPFGQGCLQRPERLFGNDRLLPFIHWEGKIRVMTSSCLGTCPTGEQAVGYISSSKVWVLGTDIDGSSICNSHGHLGSHY